ncbi:MAG: DUF4126 domain-containing protein [Thermoanaerobaculia bacterium]|nr:DUF4126 domain-containing protein [Thermoanaerobaculia bacterium]
METILSVALGLGLAAACGFRVFVPFLLMSLANRAGFLDLSPSFAWVGSDAALWALGAATVLEIGGYYLPWVDHLLDMAASPVAVVAGILATGAVITDMDPVWKWTLAVVAGGGLATTTQALTVAGRGVSTLTTAGIGNPLVATGEAVGSAGLTVLAIALPLVALTLLFVLGFWAARRLLFRRPSPAGGGAAA